MQAGSSPMKVPIDLKNIVSFIDQKDLSDTWKWISTADILLLLEFQFSKGIFFYAKYLIIYMPTGLSLH